ncbi:helix-turn-helix domain-containing protein, partial [Agromyces tardus]|uniref:AlbA family DNA-binding domain-containing protein n=1 Tax=Agromyces tardus TaxID=2583849 RepID=UPI003610C310
MNKVQIEIRVNEIVNHVLAGGKVEDDHVEAKGRWPDPKNAVQLAGMANAAGGHPILWIVGLGEKNNEIVPLDDTDPNTWWMQTQAEFAFGVAPQLSVLRVVTDHGSVFALQFETDQAPFLVTTEKGGWVTAAVPWRQGTGTRTATRAELLSILGPSAAVPGLEMVEASIEVYDETEATVSPPPLRLSLEGTLLIDTRPGVHILFAKHRQRMTLTTSTGDVIDCPDITFWSQPLG